MNFEEELSRLTKEYEHQTAVWNELKARFVALSSGASQDVRVPAAWLDDLRDAASFPRTSGALSGLQARGLRV